MSCLPRPPTWPEIVGSLLGVLLAFAVCGGLAWLLGRAVMRWLGAPF
jgi:hypothetical protein